MVPANILCLPWMHWGPSIALYLDAICAQGHTLSQITGNIREIQVRDILQNN